VYDGKRVYFVEKESKDMDDVDDMSFESQSLTKREKTPFSTRTITFLSKTSV